MDSRNWMAELFPVLARKAGDSVSFLVDQDVRGSSVSDSSTAQTGRTGDAEFVDDCVRSQLCIDDLVFPGTHNAATHSFDRGNLNILSSGLGGLRAHLLEMMTCFAFSVKDFVIGWSSNQDLTVYEQLEHGVRYLDIDVAYDFASDERIRAGYAAAPSMRNATHFYTCHSFRCVALEGVLEDVRAFARAHPLEIIMVDVQIHEEEGKPFNYAKLTRLLQSMFEPLAIPVQSRHASLLDHYRARQSLILLCNSPQMMALLPGLLWDAGILYGPWIDSSDMTHKQRELVNQMHAYQQAHGTSRIQLERSAAAGTVAHMSSAGNNSGRSNFSPPASPQAYNSPMYALGFTLSPQTEDIVRAGVARLATCICLGPLFCAHCLLMPTNRPTKAPVGLDGADSADGADGVGSANADSAGGEDGETARFSLLHSDSGVRNRRTPLLSRIASSSSSAAAAEQTRRESGLFTPAANVPVHKMHTDAVQYKQWLWPVHDNMRLMSYRMNASLREFALSNWTLLRDVVNLITVDFVQQSEVVDIVIQLNIERLKTKGLF